MTLITLYDPRHLVTNAIRRIRDRRSALAFTLILCCAAFVVRAHGTFESESRRSKSPAGSTSVAPPRTPGAVPLQQQAVSLPPRLVRVFVHEFDLYPDLIRMRPGRILLRAENEKRTEIELVLERIAVGQSPQQTARIEVAGYLKRAAQEVTLEAGEYHFYEASNPALKGTIIVEPD